MMFWSRVFRTLNTNKGILRICAPAINTFQYQSTICIKPSATLIKNGYLSLNMWRKFATNIDSGSKENIQSLVDKNKVVIFMKGIPEKPMCGFSNAVVQIMRMHGVEYDSYNVLEDDSLRAGIKEFSDWPTIPQVYMNGQFVGGCDILLQMHQSGDLIEEFKTVGIRSALLDKEQE